MYYRFGLKIYGKGELFEMELCRLREIHAKVLNTINSLSEKQFTNDGMFNKFHELCVYDSLLSYVKGVKYADQKSTT